MSLPTPQEIYMKNTVYTASPGELTVMLYDGCLKFILKAKKAIQDNKIEDRNVNIQKASNIIRELMVTLDMNVDISKNLYSLYEYMHQRLTEANIKNDVSALDEVEAFVRDYRAVWKEVVHTHRQQKYTGMSL